MKSEEDDEDEEDGHEEEISHRIKDLPEGNWRDCLISLSISSFHLSTPHVEFSATSSLSHMSASISSSQDLMNIAKSSSLINQCHNNQPSTSKLDFFVAV